MDVVEQYEELVDKQFWEEEIEKIQLVQDYHDKVLELVLEDMSEVELKVELEAELKVELVV